jgi:hypothetical protein
MVLTGETGREAAALEAGGDDFAGAIGRPRRAANETVRAGDARGVGTVFILRV